MKAFKKRRDHIQISRRAALKYTPVKNIELTEERLESGEVIVYYPITLRPWFAGLVKRFGGTGDGIRPKPLQLDKLGTEVWELIDGKRSVSQIIQKFAQTHQLQHREAEVAVTQFIRELGKRGVIGLR
jgi:hypothetical protein